jgi:hypothetical protein
MMFAFLGFSSFRYLSGTAIVIGYFLPKYGVADLERVELILRSMI